MQETTSHRGVESRSAARTNLFLAATLNSGGADRPVKIRDLSATGARIETSQTPEVGSAVILVRGGLSVGARIGWHAGRFCGLSFASRVSIQDWMGNPGVPKGPPGHPTMAAGGDMPSAARMAIDTGKAGRIAADLARVSHLLGSLGETLSGDPAVVFKYGTQLHNL